MRNGRDARPALLVRRLLGCCTVGLVVGFLYPTMFARWAIFFVFGVEQRRRLYLGGAATRNTLSVEDKNFVVDQR